jgi:hypothetical protein
MSDLDDLDDLDNLDNLRYFIAMERHAAPPAWLQYCMRHRVIAALQSARMLGRWVSV